MGRARRARRIAQAAAYGGGFGVAGIGALGVLGYGLIKAEAILARRVVGQPTEAAPDDDGRYGSGPGKPIELLVLGDSSAAGRSDTRHQTIGAILASGVSAFSGRPVRLTNVAVVGAESSELGLQVTNALDTVPSPDAAVILIGANDVTHRIDKSIAVRHLEGAVRHLREAGSEVVVGTCPDLGTLRPVAQPLRSLARRWSRDLAAAQTVGVVEAGGRTVSLGDLIGPEFAERPTEMFSKDHFHPSAAGYARGCGAAPLGLLGSRALGRGLGAPAAARTWRRGRLRVEGRHPGRPRARHGGQPDQDRRPGAGAARSVGRRPAPRAPPVPRPVPAGRLRERPAGGRGLRRPVDRHAHPVT